MGVRSAMPSITSGRSRAQRWFASVMNTPGQMALAVTPWGAQSAAVARVNCTTAALAAS